MKITLSQNMFIDHFQESSRNGQFSKEALRAIYDYYEYDEDIELDVIAICCEWKEYKSLGAVCEDNLSSCISECYNLYDELIAELESNVGCLILLDNGNYLVMD